MNKKLKHVELFETFSGKNRGAAWETQYKDMTLDEAKAIAAEIKDALSKIVPDKNYLYVKAESGLGVNIFLTFCKGKDKSEWPHQIIRNDHAYISLMIDADSKGMMVHVVTRALQIRDSGIKMLTQKRGTKEQVIAHIVKWFAANIDALNKL